MKCKDCTRRELGCHSHCEDYKQFKENLEKLKAIERAYKENISIRISKRRYYD